MRILITKLYGTKVNIEKELDDNNKSVLYSIDNCYIDCFGRLHYMYADLNKTEYIILSY